MRVLTKNQVHSPQLYMYKCSPHISEKFQALSNFLQVLFDQESKLMASNKSQHFHLFHFYIARLAYKFTHTIGFFFPSISNSKGPDFPPPEAGPNRCSNLLSTYQVRKTKDTIYILMGAGGNPDPISFFAKLQNSDTFPSTEL